MRSLYLRIRTRSRSGSVQSAKLHHTIENDRQLAAACMAALCGRVTLFSTYLCLFIISSQVVANEIQTQTLREELPTFGGVASAVSSFFGGGGRSTESGKNSKSDAGTPGNSGDAGRPKPTFSDPRGRAGGSDPTGKWGCCRICPSLFYAFKPYRGPNRWPSFIEAGVSSSSKRAPVGSGKKMGLIEQALAAAGENKASCCNICSEQYVNDLHYPKMLHPARGKSRKRKKGLKSLRKRRPKKSANPAEGAAGAAPDLHTMMSKSRDARRSKKKVPSWFERNLPPCCEFCPPGCEDATSKKGKTNALSKQKQLPALVEADEQVRFS